MQKGLGIAAIIIAVLALFVPFAGTWLTVLVAALAVFATGEGFALAVAALIVNVIHIAFFSPLLWATKGLLEKSGMLEGEGAGELSFVPWILIAIQLFALMLLFRLNKKAKSQDIASA